MSIRVLTSGSEPGLDVPAALDRAARRVAPLWPLKHFVAVNPYLGLVEQPFERVARTMARVAGAKSTLPRSFYADAIATGRISRADLEKALGEATPHPALPKDAAGLEALAQRGGEAPAPEVAPTVADVAHAVTGEDWPRFVVERISLWASTYFDEGQAPWRSPWRDLSPYAAWREEASIDRMPELMGLPKFRATAAGLPKDAVDAAQAALGRLGVPAAGVDEYLHRLLMSMGGWAAYARYLVWDSELYGKSNPTLSELLSVRLAWEVVLLEGFGERVASAWSEARGRLGSGSIGEAAEAWLAVDLVLQSAFERAMQREMVSRVSSTDAPRGAARPAVQAAFCIDVRSEVFRRALESTDPRIETIGFAGFFGFPLEFVPLGQETGGAQCPVLLTPQFTIAERVAGASMGEQAGVVERRNRRRRAEAAWRSFKFAAVSCFGFVGPVGLAYAKKLISDSLGKSRPVSHPDVYGLDDETNVRRTPDLVPHDAGGKHFGMTPEQRLAVAEGVLKAMSMTEGFARLVLLAGHGSTTVNNPHRTGLDCGACGGHTGEANARVAAAVLNDRDVRLGLRTKGLEIPEDTYFLAGLHDTATDELIIYDKAAVPASHIADLTRLEQQLAKAGHLTRAERARLLNLEPGLSVDAAVIGRSRDWSQVRPEWGLAGCAAFVAAPRHRTAGTTLAGRSFLHSYEWRKDEGFGVLELIITAPMVVASWISLQYYGSTVDNRVFGSGNKVLHNVVGTLGVLEGNGGDLRTGLPWQSVHDGKQYIHEPVRLNVMIEAPIDAMSAIIEKHEAVRHLLDNGWLNLFAIDDSGKVAKKYAGGLEWSSVDEDLVSLAAA